ncbi:MAG TPA: PspC domain-containing protein [Bryobacteraceae bacterium]|jgi:phage shock protein C|nr:PspC domain-containing protein [Bryobacteraceae bacterium]
MFCTKCGAELRETDRFCSQCGSLTPIGRTATPAARQLLLDKRNKKIAGVCAGLARYFEMDPTVMRVIWVAGAVVSAGLGVFAYLACWMIIPREPWEPPVYEPQRTY